MYAAAAAAACMHARMHQCMQYIHARIYIYIYIYCMYMYYIYIYVYIYIYIYRSLGVVGDKIAQLSAPPVQMGNFQGVRGKR